MFAFHVLTYKELYRVVYCLFHYIALDPVANPEGVQGVRLNTTPS